MYIIFILIFLASALYAHEHVHFGVDPAEVKEPIHEHPKPPEPHKPH